MTTLTSCAENRGSQNLSQNGYGKVAAVLVVGTVAADAVGVTRC